MRKIFLILILLLVSSAVMAEDFSVTLQKANPYPKSISRQGMVRTVAPPGAITAVRWWTSGWHTGRNSAPLAVWAYCRNVKGGVWYSPAIIDGYCGNPAKGGWFVPNYIPPPPAPAPPPAPKAEEKRKPTFDIVCGKVPEKKAEQPISLDFSKSDYRPSAKPYWIVDQRKDVNLTFLWYKPVTINQKEEEKSDVCPGVDPPPDPDVDDTTDVHDPSGPIIDPPPADPNQPPGQADHGTGGEPWDPSPSHENVADPVQNGSDGIPIR